MPDRLAEIRARADAYGDALAARREGRATAATESDADVFRDRARSDVLWLLERESQMMGALAEVTNMALHCCDAAIGRESLDECLRDFGLTLDEVEARDVK